MRTMLRGLAIAAIAATVALALFAGVAAAKWKKGTYSGSSQQAQHNAVQLTITNKSVGLVFFDFYDPSCVYPCMQPSWAGLSGKIHKKGKKGRKGEFQINSPASGYYGYVAGTVKGKKAQGSVYYAPGGVDPDLPPLPIKWEAEWKPQ